MLTDAQIEQVAAGSLVFWPGSQVWGRVLSRSGLTVEVDWGDGSRSSHPVNGSWFADLVAEPEAGLAFVDIETYGLDPAVHPPWEVGIIADGYGYEFQIDWGPGPLDFADDEALEVGRWAERYRPAESFPPAVARSVTALLLADRHLVGVCVAFDADRLGRLLAADGLAPPWHYHLVDMLAVCAGRLGAAPPWRSDDLLARIGARPRSPEDRHTALGDASWAREAYWQAMWRLPAPPFAHGALSLPC